MNTIWDFIRSVIHNVLVHPVLPFLPRKLAKKIHERNAAWAYPEGPFSGLD
jgi:hypothetical protein